VKRYWPEFAANGKADVIWGGYGGSLFIIDMDTRATLAYAMNRMARTTTGDMRAYGLAVAVWQAMGGAP